MKRIAGMVPLILMLLPALSVVAGHPAPKRLRQYAVRATTFRVEGAVDHPGEWSVARLQKEFAGDIRTVHYSRKGEDGSAQCVPLLSLIEAAHPKLNRKVKNHELAFVALVRADDGYTIAFSLGELLPEFGKQQVYLALDRDGKPLNEEDAPVQLIVPADSKPARWIHGIARIVVVDGFNVAGPSK